MKEDIRVCYEEDADLSYLKEKKIAIIGYGSQGRAQAQNLKDQGLNVVVGLRKGSSSWEVAGRDGLEILTVAEAAEQGEVIQILVPDPAQPDLYKSEIESNLDEGNALMFSHGFNIHYRQIVPPVDVDVVLVAPKSPGHLLRRTYVEGGGVPCLLAVEQDYTGEAKEVALAYAHGIGGTRAGVLQTTFREETETDLFGEQAVLCGGVTALVKAGFETLVGADYAPEIAYFECLHELKLIVDLMYEGGLSHMWRSVSDTAEYGGLTRGAHVIRKESRKEMRKMLGKVQNGEFAREWMEEDKAGRPLLKGLAEKEHEHQIEVVGKRLRRMMSWLGER